MRCKFNYRFNPSTFTRDLTNIYIYTNVIREYRIRKFVTIHERASFFLVANYAAIRFGIRPRCIYVSAGSILAGNWADL